MSKKYCYQIVMLLSSVIKLPETKEILDIDTPNSFIYATHYSLRNFGAKINKNRNRESRYHVVQICMHHLSLLHLERRLNEKEKCQTFLLLAISCIKIRT